MEMVDPISRQNCIDVLSLIQRTGSRKNDALRIYEVGKMWPEVLAGFDFLQKRPESRFYGPKL
jgi:hypothetical protein